MFFLIYEVRAAMMRRSSEAIEALDEADSPVEGLEEGTLAIQSNGKHITGKVFIQTHKKTHFCRVPIFQISGIDLPDANHRQMI